MGDIQALSWDIQPDQKEVMISELMIGELMKISRCEKLEVKE